MAVATIDFASKVLDDIPPNENGIKEFDVFLIITVIQIIIQIYQCLKKPQTTYKILQNPNFIDRVRLRRACRRRLNEEKTNEIVRALLNKGKDLTLDQITEILSEQQ